VSQMKYKGKEKLFTSENEYKGLLSIEEPEKVDFRSEYRNFKIIPNTYEKPRPRIVMRHDERTEQG
jgi:hypothetical protein